MRCIFCGKTVNVRGKYWDCICGASTWGTWEGETRYVIPDHCKDWGHHRRITLPAGCMWVVGEI